ncbi:hypothetical protein MMC25_000708 [Agyrium rufum]|nr:hypothetical protein [Agyrium rufum]
MDDYIANTVLDQYAALPERFKPARDSDGVSHWVPLAGIVLGDSSGRHECVALATGAKCLPAAKVPAANGCVLHDSHAEILSIRLLNYFLIQECHALAQDRHRISPYIRWRDEKEQTIHRGLQPFTVKESIKIFMYCSEAPCGDASMELTIQAQEDATPWPVSDEASSEGVGMGPTLRGRGSFSELGMVRRKPARGDSPPTLSKSCSDKLALKQCTSLLSSLATLLISPENAYLHRLILPSSQHVPEACERAFGASGRMCLMADKTWPGGFGFRPFQVGSSKRVFGFSREAIASRTSDPKVSNLAALKTGNVQETVINGILQGRRQGDIRGASAVSRRRLLQATFEIISLLAIPRLLPTLTAGSYQQVKGLESLTGRRIVKKDVIERSLSGWLPNTVDYFSIEPFG